jgi:hypothetical protein
MTNSQKVANISLLDQSGTSSSARTVLETIIYGCHQTGRYLMESRFYVRNTQRNGKEIPLILIGLGYDLRARFHAINRDSRS